MSKTKKIIFTISIILNIVLLGMMGGMIYKRNHGPSWQAFQEQLQPATRALVQDSFEQARADVRPLLSALMKEREELVVIMNEEPFDAAKFDAATARIQKIQKQVSDTKASSIKNLMTKVPHEERVKLTDNLARFFTWDRGRKHKEQSGPAERVP